MQLHQYRHSQKIKNKNEWMARGDEGKLKLTADPITLFANSHLHCSTVPTSTVQHSFPIPTSSTDLLCTCCEELLSPAGLELSSISTYPPGCHLPTPSVNCSLIRIQTRPRSSSLHLSVLQIVSSWMYRIIVIGFSCKIKVISSPPFMLAGRNCGSYSQQILSGCKQKMPISTLGRSNAILG